MLYFLYQSVEVDKQTEYARADVTQDAYLERVINPVEVAKEAVRQLVHTYGTNNPFRLSQSLGLYLLPSRTPPGLWGAFISHNGRAFLSYDVNATGEQQCLYVAHGLAHFLLHREHSSFFLELDEPGPSVWESEARAFAHDLLFDVGCRSMPSAANIAH